MNYRGTGWNRFFDSQEESRASPTPFSDSCCHQDTPLIEAVWSQYSRVPGGWSAILKTELRAGPGFSSDGLPVIRPESGATLSGALESRTDQPKDFIRRGGRPWDRAAPRGALASSWRGWPRP